MKFYSFLLIVLLSLSSCSKKKTNQADPGTTISGIGQGNGFTFNLSSSVAVAKPNSFGGGQIPVFGKSISNMIPQDVFSEDLIGVRSDGSTYKALEGAKVRSILGIKNGLCVSLEMGDQYILTKAGQSIALDFFDDMECFNVNSRGDVVLKSGKIYRASTGKLEYLANLDKDKMPYVLKASGDFVEISAFGAHYVVNTLTNSYKEVSPFSSFMSLSDQFFVGIDNKTNNQRIYNFDSGNFFDLKTNIFPTESLPENNKVSFLNDKKNGFSDLRTLHITGDLEYQYNGDLKIAKHDFISFSEAQNLNLVKNSSGYVVREEDSLSLVANYSRDKIIVGLVESLDTASDKVFFIKNDKAYIYSDLNSPIREIKSDLSFTKIIGIK